MTITAPRSGFKRSSERKVGELSLRRWAFADAREEDRALERYEEVGFSAAAASVLVSQEKSERLADVMLAEDQSTFDADGWVR